MNEQMSERLAMALRATLVERVNASRTPRRWLRWRRVGPALAALAVVGGGTAYATGAFTGLPGGVTATPLAPPVTVAGTGTQIVDLGQPPATANRIEIQFTCLTAGTFTFADGASVGCDALDVNAQAVTASYNLPVIPGQTTTTLTAGPGQRWKVAATYVSAATTPWGVNAHGQTYGTRNSHGTPDLVAARATNGQTGYVYATQLRGPMPTSRKQALAIQASEQPRAINVYESDGITVIGQFVVGGGSGTTAP